ncbi:MAG: [FeFe] hydrogenase H-cluster maturation GTPase HydF [Bacteroidales bacterium]|nr:[FeFe] hydrogenase H-cluster maturation GTPase HydF [Bacteroidales bacterium]
MPSVTISVSSAMVTPVCFYKNYDIMKTKRVFIGIFGRKNQGKSSLINALTRQDIAIVSPMAGTTTDPVKKSMEIFGIGPVVLIDTAGIDDDSTLGQQRVSKTMDTIPTIDAGIVVLTHNEFTGYEKELCSRLTAHHIPFLFVYNKHDLCPVTDTFRAQLSSYGVPVVTASALHGSGIQEVIDAIVSITPPSAYKAHTLIGDKIHEGDTVLLVMPQDEEAPEGRLILPQVQMIRDILDNHAMAVCIQPEELSACLQKHTPRLVITDSQAFKEVNAMLPREIPLTGFSIIMARAKGHFEQYIQGTPHISRLKDGDRILMLESCTHPSRCNDIGRVKIPGLIRKFTGKQLEFDIVSALSPLPELTPYAMAIQCGACMVSDKQVNERIQHIINRHIPVSNYGMTLAYLNHIFDRAVEIFV